MARGTATGLRQIQLRTERLLVSDEEGNLDYVPEASYTEELWEEMRKRNNMTLKH